MRSKLKSGIRRLLGRSDSASAHTTVASPRPAAPVAAPVPDDDVAGPADIDFDLVAQFIEDRIRPALRADGGDIELVEVRGADAHVRLQGACRGCPGAAMTLKMGVEAVPINARVLQEKIW